MTTLNGAETARALAEHVERTRFEDLPPATIARAKDSIIDTLAVMIAGSGGDGVPALLDIARTWGGREESTIVVHGDRVPSYLATLLNGAMVHQLDFDDTHDVAVCHPTSATLPAALALAEAEGDTTGRDLLTAVAVGNDVASRLGLAIHGTLWDYPWVRAPVVGIFGTVAAAARVLHLDATRTHHAFGIALPQVGGTLECLEGDSSIRSLRDGLAYKDGVLSALMAARGVRGDAGVFDGRYGLFNAYFRGEYDREQVVEGLGVRFETENVSLKPWPSCRHTHATLTALFDVLDRPDVDRREVERVVVHVGDGNLKICEAIAAGRLPERRIDALCNLPFAVAIGLAHGDAPIAAFNDDRLRDPAVLAALARITPVYSPEQNRHGTIEPGWVEVHLPGGAVIEARAERALGHPERPLTPERLRAKLIACVAASALPLPDGSVDQLVPAVARLEDLADATELAELVRARARPAPTPTSGM